MAGEWRDTTIGGFVTLQRGHDLTDAERRPGTVPVMGAAGQNGFHDTALAQGPGIVIGRSGASFGQVHYCEKDFWPHNTGLYVTDFGENSPRFAYYLLKALDFSRFNSGSAQPSLNRNFIYPIEVQVPPPDEQRAIAHILGTLDDKIELNRKMNETLEAMARSLFKSWFVDFDPVRRNAARARNQPSPPAPLPKGEGSNHYRCGYAFAGLVEAARALRKKQTPAEIIFWELVRDRQLMGLKFRRQHQMGDYIADFYCHEHRLVIELDGGIHAEKRKKDHKRDAWMKAQEFIVLRFPNQQLLDDPESVLRAIAEGVRPTSPHPLPLGEGQGEGSVEDLDRLFPDSFEDSELGEIPRGWAVGHFGDVVDHLKDQENPLLSPDVLFYHFSLPAFDEGQSPKTEYGEGIKSQKSRVPAGVVLLSKLNPEIERVWLVDVSPTDRAVCSTEFLVLRGRSPFTRGFVYCLARTPLFRQQIESLVTGTSKSHQRAQVESILNVPVVFPPSSIVVAFDRMSETLLARTLECRRDSRTLTALRDTLLPKLISGELQVKDAERFMEKTI